MCKNEALRKIKQLFPIVDKKRKRKLAAEQVMSTELAGLVSNGEVDNAQLIAVLVSAVQALSAKVESIEAKISKSAPPKKTYMEE